MNNQKYDLSNIESNYVLLVKDENDEWKIFCQGDTSIGIRDHLTKLIDQAKTKLLNNSDN